MTAPRTRRHFLQTVATTGTALGLGDFAALGPLGPASADEARVTPELVRFSPDIEPVVRLIEETPQDRCVAAMVEQLRRGLPYRQFLAALYLAAIRAAKWYGGFHGYDHNAYVVHSAHQLSLDLPPGEQLLPAFYALSSFKGTQRAYPTRRNGTQVIQGTPPLRGVLPPENHAEDELHGAMREWDPDRAELAVVALARSRGTAAVLEPLWHYAGRDWEFIGHKAILVANSCRLLETIGWQHGEHILRYVVAALAGGGRKRAEHADVRPYRANLQRVEMAARRLPGGWAASAGDTAFTRDLVALLREGKGEEACDTAVRRLVDGKARAGAVWDAVHLAAGEMVLSVQPRGGNRPDGNALHANTAANALHYAFRASALQDTRLLLTLQALAWMHLYRESRRNNLLPGVMDITNLVAPKLPDQPDAAVEEILATRTERPHRAALLAFALARHGRPETLLHAARRLLAVKSSGDPHDIKFPVAIFEDLDLVGSAWRPHLLAAAVFSFWGSERPDLPVMQQVRQAVQKL
jgi:hypothetical protein